MSFNKTSHHLWGARVELIPRDGFDIEGVGTVIDLVVHNDSRVVAVIVLLDRNPAPGHAGEPRIEARVQLSDLEMGRARIIV